MPLVNRQRRLVNIGNREQYEAGLKKTRRDYAPSQEEKLIEEA
jgi:hypothetical protein